MRLCRNLQEVVESDFTSEAYWSLPENCQDQLPIQILGSPSLYQSALSELARVNPELAGKIQTVATHVWNLVRDFETLEKGTENISKSHIRTASTGSELVKSLLYTEGINNAAWFSNYDLAIAAINAHCTQNFILAPLNTIITPQNNFILFEHMIAAISRDRRRFPIGTAERVRRQGQVSIDIQTYYEYINMLQEVSRFLNETGKYSEKLASLIADLVYVNQRLGKGSLFAHPKESRLDTHFRAKDGNNLFFVDPLRKEFSIGIEDGDTIFFPLTSFTNIADIPGMFYAPDNKFVLGSSSRFVNLTLSALSKRYGAINIDVLEQGYDEIGLANNSVGVSVIYTNDGLPKERIGKMISNLCSATRRGGKVIVFYPKDIVGSLNSNLGDHDYLLGRLCKNGFSFVQRDDVSFKDGRPDMSGEPKAMLKLESKELSSRVLSGGRHEDRSAVFAILQKD